MARILLFLKPTDGDPASFEPEMTHAMGLAFDAACERVADDQNLLLREVLAKAILAHAQRGERDPEKLCRSALASVGVETSAPDEAPKKQCG